MSAGEECATSQNASPVAGVRFSARPLYDEAADMAAHDAGAETQFEREEGASD